MFENMFHDLDLSLEECRALLEFLVQSNKLPRDEIYKSIACIRERSKKDPTKELHPQHPLPLPHVKKTMKQQKQQQQQHQQNEGKRNVTLVQSRYRHVAIRIAYDGSTYSGFAENCGSDTDNSVEKHVFAALSKTCLITERSSCNYSRCGRTDRGVSAFGQVIALHIRSRIPKVDGKGIEIQEEDLPRNSYQTIATWQKKKKNKNKKMHDNVNRDEQYEAANYNNNRINNEEEFVQELIYEFDYCRILNGVLPDTIRAIGWTPVSNEFSARFSARDRTYKYFFVRKNYNLSAMQQALDKLTGTHDFRNLCKMDTEAVSNFQRLVKYAKIVVINGNHDNNCYRQMCYFEICGQAFLWHMIRCIVAVCFMVGSGYEDPCVVDDLLDVHKYPAKPSYAMAPDTPLVLHSCSYQNVTFGHSSICLWELTNTLERRWEEAAIAAERIRDAIESLQHESYVQLDEFCSFLKEVLGSKQQQKQCSSNDKINGVMFLTDEVILETIHRVQKQERLDETKNNILEDPPLGNQDPISTTADATDIISDSRKTIISWKHALAAIYELGFPSPASILPVKGGKTLGRQGVVIHKHVKLMERSTGTTYQEKISSMKGKKRERYEMNMMKKQQPCDDQEFYERMTKYGGSGI
jgi:tRNA pseudouridine38/39 synthase